MEGLWRSLALPVFIIRSCRRYLRHAGFPGKSLWAPMLIVSVGAAWLADNLEIAASVNWFWTTCLAAPGILIFAFGRWHRLNFVAGSFLTIASIIAVLVQTKFIRSDLEYPCLVIVFGVLLLFAALVRVPLPSWMRDAKRPNCVSGND